MTDTKDLPPLPGGWEWMQYTDGKSYYASGEYADIGIYGNGLDITLIGKIGGVSSNGDAAIDSNIPIAVLHAVLRANGYSFTS